LNFKPCCCGQLIISIVIFLWGGLIFRGLGYRTAFYLWSFLLFYPAGQPTGFCCVDCTVFPDLALSLHLCLYFVDMCIVWTILSTIYHITQIVHDPIWNASMLIQSLQFCTHIIYIYLLVGLPVVDYMPEIVLQASSKTCPFCCAWNICIWKSKFLRDVQASVQRLVSAVYPLNKLVGQNVQTEFLTTY